MVQWGNMGVSPILVSFHLVGDFPLPTMMMGEIYVNFRQVYILSRLKIHPHNRWRHWPPNVPSNEGFDWSCFGRAIPCGRSSLRWLMKSAFLSKHKCNPQWMMIDIWVCRLLGELDVVGVVSWSFQFPQSWLQSRGKHVSSLNECESSVDGRVVDTSSIYQNAAS